MGIFKEKPAPKESSSSKDDSKPLEYGNEWYTDAAGRKRQRKADWYKESQARANREANLKPGYKLVQNESGRWSQRKMTKADLAEQERKEKARQERAERMERQAAEARERAALPAENIGQEFAQLFAAQVPEMTVERAQRSGRIDASRVARVGAGNLRVFQHVTFSETAGVAGSLAIVISYADLYHYTEQYDSPQVTIWLYTLHVLELAAQKAGLAFQIFAGGSKNDEDPSNAASLQSAWDTVEEAIRTSWYEGPKYNCYTRQRQSVLLADMWHAEVNPNHRRITLLVTMFPENPGGAITKDMDAYRSWLAEAGRLDLIWAQNSHLFVMGVRLQDSAPHLYGPWVEYGIARHFEETFASARRYRLDEVAELIPTITDLAWNMARV